MSARSSQFVNRFTATALIVLSVFVSIGGAEGAVGDSRGTVGIPSGSLCPGPFESSVSGTASLMIPGGKAGFPNVLAILVTSCQGKIFLLNPATEPGTLLKTITPTVIPTNGWGALALRADKGDLLACTVTTTGTDVYSIDFSPFNLVADGTAVKIRSAPAGPTGSALSTCAGIAWDPQTDTIYQNTNGPAVLRYPASGNALTPFASGCPGATAGIGIAGTSLFVGCQITD